MNTRKTVEEGFPIRLTEGYKAFFSSRLINERERYEKLAVEGQRPEIMIISCCDSRAAPEIIFDAAPGEMFVLRNVANLVPPYRPDGEYHGTSAALEFAVQQLRVKHVVVLGHGRCGGVHAFCEQMDGADATPLSPGDFIGKWISLLEPAMVDLRCAKDAQKDARQRAMEEASIRNSIQNLLSFPCVEILVQRGQLQLHGAWFDIASGELWVHDPASGNFMPADF
jgi:carbonic anhydrase